MITAFKSNPFYDVLLYSGYDTGCEQPLSQKMTEKAATKALRYLNITYKRHKKNLEFSYPQFLGAVEKNMGQLKDPVLDPVARRAVSKKLLEMGFKKVEKEKQEWSWVHRIFHKIGQLFSSRGFRTEAVL